MAKKRWIKFFGMWFSGFLMGFGLLLGLQNWPQQKHLWMNPITGYLVWASNAPTNDFIVLDRKEG